MYRDLGLSVRRRRRKRLTRVPRPRPILTAPNHEWAIDFASDMTGSGRRLRIFSVADCYTRECLTLEIDTSMPSRRVTRARIMETRGAPVAIRSDNVLNVNDFFNDGRTGCIDRVRTRSAILWSLRELRFPWLPRSIGPRST